MQSAEIQLVNFARKPVMRVRIHSSEQDSLSLRYNKDNNEESYGR